MCACVKLFIYLFIYSIYVCITVSSTKMFPGKSKKLRAEGAQLKAQEIRAFMVFPLLR